MLEVEQLTYAYGEVQVLHGVSMEVPERSVVCLMGRNGVGKTTLMRNLVGLYRPTGGSVKLQGEDISGRPAHARTRAGIGYVPQGRHIFPRLSVEENLRTGLGARRDGARSVPEDIYDFFPVLKDMRKRMGGNLSGGQQQQLAIGRALAAQPRLLILDEPTEGIQPNIIQMIGDLLKQLVEDRGMTVLIVEQYLDFVREFSDRFYIMNRGVIVSGDATDQLHETIVRKYLHV